MKDPHKYRNWKPEDFPPAHKAVRDVGDPGSIRAHLGLALALAIAALIAWIATLPPGTFSVEPVK